MDTRRSARSKGEINMRSFAAIDYKSGQAMTTFDPAKQSAESLSRFVGECGYKVKEIKAV
jgi:hypothetical protein